MFPLFETIAIVDGIPQHIDLHQQRYENALTQYYGSSCSAVCLADIFQNGDYATFLSHYIVRCRIDYNQFQNKVQFFPYHPPNIRTFQPVICDEIDYSLKYADRRLLNQLLAQKQDCDEIMIVKQGIITDCTIGNLIFKRQGEWFTPAEPLLQGTQRQALLAAEKIQTRAMPLRELELFEEIRLINAMNPFCVGL